MVIVEDIFGLIVLFQIYYFFKELIVLVELIVYEGWICVVKELFFKVIIGGVYLLRVDYVNDIVWFFWGDM